MISFRTNIILMVNIMFLINTFFIYSILGYLLETTCAYIFKYNFNSGILYGPLTPVYGFGVIAIIIISKYLFYNLHLPRVYETIIVFIIITIIISIIEWLGGITIEKLFNITFWDYSKHKYHIGKYISLKMSLIWGISSIIFIYIINPLLENIIKKIPVSITVIISILFIIDIILTTINKLKGL